MEVYFCMTCGSPLETRLVDGTERRACSSPDCKFVHWGNYSIGVGALVIKDEKILLVRRAQDPGKGFWTNPGGYVEQTELIHETIRREVMEEAGVEAAVRSVIAVRDQPRQIHNVYIAFAMDYVGGDPVPDGFEVDRAGFFSLREMEEMNVAGFTRWLVHAALQRKQDGLTIDKEPIVSLDGYGLYRTE
ncbi:NUDIX hydrolase [Paenibacillus humicola]|uniref:NUDIX hydrolase n=1 Tax=Paenibacillus humicola TaxID=3110540 RepID=UPI00237ADAB3|nr:NUDIX hydrolase [Paenibacillus humicola]